VIQVDNTESEDGQEEIFSPFIESELLTLLPIKVNNLKLYLKWNNDSEIRKYLGFQIPWMKEDQKNMMEPDINPYKRRAYFEIWHNIDKRPIGVVSLHSIQYISRIAELGINIGEKNYWGKGIGTTALGLVIKYGFEELNLHKICASVEGSNMASYKVLEKLGLKREAVLKKTKYVDGVYIDGFRYAIFQEEYFTKLNKGSGAVE